MSVDSGFLRNWKHKNQVSNFSENVIASNGKDLMMPFKRVRALIHDEGEKCLDPFYVPGVCSFFTLSIPNR